MQKQRNQHAKNQTQQDLDFRFFQPLQRFHRGSLQCRCGDACRPLAECAACSARPAFSWACADQQVWRIFSGKPSDLSITSASSSRRSAASVRSSTACGSHKPQGVGVLYGRCSLVLRGSAFAPVQCFIRVARMHAMPARALSITPSGCTPSCTRQQPYPPTLRHRGIVFLQAQQ